MMRAHGPALVAAMILIGIGSAKAQYVGVTPEARVSGPAAANMPPGGWSTLYEDPSGNLRVTLGSSGTLTDLATITVSATQSTQIVPSAAGPRVRATLYNLSSTGVMWFRADGGQAAVGTGIPVEPGYGYEWVYPLTGAGPAAPINAIMAGGSPGSASGEYVQ